jgi:6-pyruvoyl-tetrahydropterin synthase
LTSRLHGHNWQVEVSVESAVLDALGIAIDFREIKKQTKDYKVYIGTWRKRIKAKTS